MLTPGHAAISADGSILTGIAPTIGINLLGHGYDCRTTVAPWFRGLFIGLRTCSRSRTRRSSTGCSILLGWEPVIDLPRLTASASLSEERAAAALATLATSGKVGFDLAAGAYFHRELPLGAGPERVHPRLASARELVAAGRVGLAKDGAMSGDHRVWFRPRGTGPDTCTCPWWGQHRGTRGPCQHVLAVRIVLGQPGGAR